MFDKSPSGESHDSRQSDIERAAQEITQAQVWRAEFYKMHAGPKATKRQRIEAIALIDHGTSAEEFRLLCLRLRFCNDNCDNYRVSREREAALLGRSVAAIDRTSKALEATKDRAGYQLSTRKRNDPSLRRFDVPEPQVQAAKELLALYESANVRVLESAEMRLEGPESADLQSRKRKSASLTLVMNSKEREYARISIRAGDSDAMQSEGEYANGHPAAPLPAKKGHSRADALRAMELYNEVAARCGLPHAKTLSPAREKQIIARLREIGGFAEYERVILPNLETSKHCRGENDRGWVASFSFLCQQKSFHKLYEGDYNRGKRAPSDTAVRRELDSFRGAKR